MNVAKETTMKKTELTDLRDQEQMKEKELAGLKVLVMVLKDIQDTSKAIYRQDSKSSKLKGINLRFLQIL